MAKLKKVLKYICGEVHTRIYEVYKTVEEEEKIDIVYAGLFSDIPWSLTEKEMIESSETDEFYPLEFCDKLGPIPEEWDTGMVEDSIWNERSGLIIFIKE